ncbi:BTB/POZ domain-containing protein [Phthorimaea operculella]|nr:BTB/POZ domain-containing protein [Phthorimaea operculella]
MLHAKFATPALLGVYTSQDYVICGLVVFQAKITIYQINIQFFFVFSVKLFRVFDSDNLTYAIKFSSDTLNVKDRVLLTDDTEWRQMYEGDNIGRNVDVTMTLDVYNSNPGIFESLLNDIESTDFELRGENGSVRVHKAVLANFSPVIKTMLSGQWKEVDSGAVEVSHTTKETLIDLKNYMYLQKLPDTGVEKLAMLAAYYMMSDLKQLCAVKLLSKLSAENATELLDFAMKYKIDKLMLAILESVHKESILVKDIEKKCNVNHGSYEYY